MDAAPFPDITGLTEQPGGAGGGGGPSLPISLLCPLRERRFSLHNLAGKRSSTGEETLQERRNLLNSGLSAGSWTVCSSGFFFSFFPLVVCGFPDCAPAAERTAQCDSRRLWRKPYLVKVFVAVTQRDARL